MSDKRNDKRNLNWGHQKKERNKKKEKRITR